MKRNTLKRFDLKFGDEIAMFVYVYIAQSLWVKYT